MDNDNNLIELNVLGITRKQVHANAYAVILETRDSTKRVPIIIGAAEAQAIAVRIEGVVTPRPLTHDVVVSMMHGFNLRLDRVVIESFVDGVFHAYIHISNEQGEEIRIDARTSDAIALSMRTNAPIFINPTVLAEVAYDHDPATDQNVLKSSQVNPEERHAAVQQLVPLSVLKKRLQELIDQEEYERAAEIQRLINERTNKK